MLVGTPVALFAATLSKLDNGWAEFSAYQARSRLEIVISIGTGDTSSAPPTYWVRRSVTRTNTDTDTSETDTRQCPAVLENLRELERLKLPRPEVPLLNSNVVTVTADGITYAMRTPAAYAGARDGELVVRSNAGTPLAEWIERTEAVVEACLPLKR